MVLREELASGRATTSRALEESLEQLLSPQGKVGFEVGRARERGPDPYL